MGFKLGIVGLPNVGKSTLFNALAATHVPVSNYPFCTIDQNLGVVAVPDERLGKIARIIGSAKAVPTTIEFVDIAGLVKGASCGEGLGNQFLGHIREVDAIAHVVRCFADPSVVHVTGELDPIGDIEIIDAELLMADMATVEKRRKQLEAKVKSGDKESIQEVSVLKRVYEGLSKGQPAREINLTPEGKKYIFSLHLLTQKPLIYIANVGEDQHPDDPWVKKIEDKANGVAVVPICAKIEAEVEDFSLAEAAEYLKEIGIAESGFAKLIRVGYKLLNLATFFTANEKEAHAWTVERGTKVPQAAGKVHSDMERGFIRAEVVSFTVLKQAGSLLKAKEEGQLRMEGKDYVVADGDIIYYHFKV